jgi:hypothetical protein
VRLRSFIAHLKAKCPFTRLPGAPLPAKFVRIRRSRKWGAPDIDTTRMAASTQWSVTGRSGAKQITNDVIKQRKRTTPHGLSMELGKLDGLQEAGTAL